MGGALSDSVRCITPGLCHSLLQTSPPGRLVWSLFLGPFCLLCTNELRLSASLSFASAHRVSFKHSNLHMHLIACVLGIKDKHWSACVTSSLYFAVLK